MNDIFRGRKKNHDHVLHGEEGQINYRDFGHWVDMADEAESPRNSKRAF